MKLHVFTGGEAKALRKKRGLVQADFWEPFGATQSAGSRYESQMDIPEPIQILMNIAFGSEQQASAIVASLRTLGQPKTKRMPQTSQEDGPAAVSDLP